MKRVLIEKIPIKLPGELEAFTNNAKIYDSSCSAEARVYFIEKDGGYYLKCAEKNSLKSEALMTDYFHKKGLGANVVSYVSDDRDFLITSKVGGEDGTTKRFLDDPKRLSEVLGTNLRKLHDLDFSDCPVKNRTESYRSLVDSNFKKSVFELSLTERLYKFKSKDEAYRVFIEGKNELKTDTLLHGDYCLPNVMLNDDFSLSGFIDLGNGGVGDRHIDVFWGRWTLLFNLGTDEYAQRFFDAYGKDKINFELLKTVAAAEVFG